MRLIIFLLVLWPQQIFDYSYPNEFIVWNIGQGQWTTWVHDLSCHHFDIGGEFNAGSKVLARCQKLRNEIYISHWDQDHWSFLPSYIRKIPHFCIHPPHFGQPPPRIAKVLAHIDRCATLDPTIEQIFVGQPGRGLERNPNSQVFMLKKSRILIPGDSTRNDEKTWIPKASREPLTGWVLGHHGSRTSTDSKSLEHFKHVGWAVATSRFKRYGHPSEKVVQRLKEKHIPLLKTEDWGDLHFLL